jgi:ethanolamine ammonia-lyase large subunit
MNPLERGAHAERLMNDELLKDAFEQLRQFYLKNLEEWPLDDSAGSDRLRIALKLIQGVRNNLASALRDGQHAKFQLEEERKKARLLDQFPWRRTRA